MSPIVCKLFFPLTQLQVEKALKNMSVLVDSIMREAQEHIDLERKAVLEAKALADNAANEEISRLQDQNAYLIRLVQNERAKSENAKDELLKHVSGLLGDFVTERDRSLREALANAVESNEKGEGAMSHFANEHVDRVELVVTRGQEFSMSLDKKGGEHKRLRDGALKAGFPAFTVMEIG